MPDAFISMREWFQRDAEAVAVALEPQTREEPQVVVDSFSEIDEAIDDARRFRAALADGVECCVADVLRDLASDVLARELRLAPCDLRAIVERAIQRYAVDPVRIRVHRDERHLVEAFNVTVVPDDSVRSGDAIIETHHGSIDASFGVRLDRVLSRLRA